MNCEDGVEEVIDEGYVLNVQNPVQLVSSLAFFLRERNYVCLYDTSILSSPEKYLKRNAFVDISKDFLYKWFLFFTGVSRHLSNFENLILIPEVVREVSNILQAAISIIEKKKLEYKELSSQEREELCVVYQQLAKNEETLRKILQTIHPSEKPHPTIFNSILNMVKFLDAHLELKKSDSRVTNDTDERIVARVFYEVLVNGHNTCVYTRDDDIRKLISVTFRLLISKFAQKDAFKEILRNLFHRNILVLKFNYEKKVFSRFFESSTLENIEDFKFSRRIMQETDVNTILTGLEKHVADLVEVFEDYHRENNPEEDDILDEDIIHSLKKMYDHLHKLEIKEDIKNNSKRIYIYQELSYLLESLGEMPFAEKIMETTRQEQKQWIEKQLRILQENKTALETEFVKISQQHNDDLEYKVIKKIKCAVEKLEENSLKIYFFQSALEQNFFRLDEDSYASFTQLLQNFSTHGFEVESKETPVPIEKIAQITNFSIAEVIKIIEKHDISHEGTYAYLSQKHLLFFLFGR
ncbi:hypothetical protein [Candidatus Uabimicrobium amorphum]|uniref:Uncharacterized protein n=1 Tax=Uabimicrobium amorphum TaxID=2596890 RepID=A0A5S9IQZ3_UABAM|nr:hypothetical protein [Candidatus Uabimicrobium amorphum]BBM86459.1 hypothetical protein UABAM_04845 [Candidatus Uabimicrobium amorphum]